MSKIQFIKARQILDSRGNPTVEAVVLLEGGHRGRAAVPSGASTGSGEALELRDGGEKWGGQGVTKAVSNVDDIIGPELIGMDAADQEAIDSKMLELDGTENKSNLGANAILAVSLAVAKAEAVAEEMALYQYIAKMAETTKLTLPMPMMNVMNGGMHANWATDIQEYMIMPIGAPTFAEAIRYGAETFHALAKILKEKGYAVTVGDEGGYAPRETKGNREPFELMTQAIEAAGYRPGKDIVLLTDAAASEFYGDGAYNLKTESKKLSGGEMIDFYRELVDEFPIVSIEDGLSESDWDNWTKMTEKLGDRIQIVGDDLLVTNTKLLQKAIDLKACNAILIKPNQIGSLTETINAVKLAHSNGFNTIMSHRSGETEDTTIAHLAVGLNTGQIKTGSMSRSERVAKYNELLRIAEAEPDMPLAHPFE